MTIVYLAGSIITGLSSDTKPTTASNGSIFIETDTGARYIINSGTWTLLAPGGNLDSLTDVDLTTAAPTNNQVLTYTTTGTKWVPATPPGSGGGEANTLSSEGTGEGTLPGTKVGSALGIKSLKQGTNITLTNNANDVTISSSAGGGTVTPSSTDTFTNKTINADGTGNSITNIENADIKAAAGIVTSKLADSANFILKTLDNSFGAHYQDITKMTAPGNPGANDIRLYVDTADTHMKIKNSAGTVVDLHNAGSSGITASSTDTLTNKTISRTTNTLPYLNPAAFTIYREGGAVKLVTNATGAVASHATLGPAVDAVLANTADPSVEILSGFYNLDSGFTGWNVITLTNIKIHPNTYINVPESFSSKVWKLNPTDTTVYRVTIDGGRYDEQGTSPTYLWDVIGIEPISTNAPTTVGAVHDCEFKNMFVWRCNRPIYLHTTNGSWINQNRFVNIYTEGGKIIGAEFEHTGTWTSGLSGTSGNYFECVDGQATALDTTNHFPVTLYGFKNVIGEFNIFVDCKPWDLSGNGGSAHGMTIGANATGTIISGGIVDSWGFIDAGTKTSRNAWDGIVHNNLATFGGATTFGAATTFKETLTVNKNAEASAAERLFSMGVSDASGDLFTLDNLYTTNARFNPIFRGIITSASQNAGSTALYFQGIITDANNTSSTEPIVVFGAKTDTNAVIDNNRPILGISNQFSYAYNFYGDRLDLIGNKLVNAILSGQRVADTVQTSNYTVLTTDQTIRCDAQTTGAFTVTLPTAVSAAGRVYTIIKTDTGTNPVTIATTSSQTINGILTWVLRHSNAWVTIESDGANWKVIAHGPKYGTNTFFRGGATPNRTYIAGLLPGSSDSLQTSTTGPTANTLYAFPFLVQRTTQFDTIRCQVTTLGGGSNLRMGLYADNGSGVYPGKLLFDSGNIAASSTGTKEATITSGVQLLQPGIYWLTYENSATVPQIRCLPGAGGVWAFGGYANDFATSTPQYGWTVAHTVGTLPDPYTAGATALTTASAVGTPAPAVGLRAA